MVVLTNLSLNRRSKSCHSHWNGLLKMLFSTALPRLHMFFKSRGRLKVYLCQICDTGQRSLETFLWCSITYLIDIRSWKSCEQHKRHHHRIVWSLEKFLWGSINYLIYNASSRTLLPQPPKWMTWAPEKYIKYARARTFLPQPSPNQPHPRRSRQVQCKQWRRKETKARQSIGAGT